MRNKTKKIMVKNVQIGNQNKIVIQTMLTCPPKNINETLKQLAVAKDLGAEIVRVSVSSYEDAIAIKEIVEQTDIPIIADIHFDYKLALLAIDNGVAKIRINPGTLKEEEIIQLANKCKEKKIPIRVGINGGSLEKDILAKYQKPSAPALIESLKRQISKLEAVGFTDIIISIKTSNVLETIKAYRLAAQIFNYPLHLGLSEAGPLLGATIKSACALAPLIEAGIGDTIRISITGSIEDEIRVCKEILAQFDLYQKPNFISCPTCGRTEYQLMTIADKIATYLNSIKAPITVAVMGCIVNGPGEAREADIGIAGGKDGNIALFKKGKIIKTYKENEIEAVLKAEINALAASFN